MAARWRDCAQRGGFMVDRIHPSENRFAAGPSDAVDCLADLARSVQTVVAKARASAEVRATLRGTTLDHLWGDDDQRDWNGLLSGIPIYWWSHDTAELVAAASRSYPVEEEEARPLDSITSEPPSWLPRVTRALCVFEKPTLYWDNEFGERVALSAIAWQVGISVRHRDVGLSIRGVQWCRNMAVPCWWSDGGTKNDKGRALFGLTSDSYEKSYRDSFNDERLVFVKWICAASMFIEQEIVATDEVRPERHTRKRLLSVLPNETERMIRVVRLRREHADSERASGTESAVEWSHRWTVRGHWRRQWFQRRNANCPIWIHPHVKGPADKPFKGEPTITVHSVVR